MKKLSVLFAVLLMTVGASAQFKYGVKAGINAAQLSALSDVPGAKATDMKIGFHAGLHMNYSFTDLIGLQYEAVFSMQGGSNKVSIEGTAATTKLNFNYINIPVLLEIKPFQNFSIFVGPQFGFNIFKSLSASMGGQSGSISGKEFENNMGKVNTIDIAAIGGIQYAIMGQFLISARYNFGFTKTLELAKGGMCNRVIQIGVGYQF